jgi:hypothetical protein
MKYNPIYTTAFRVNLSESDIRDHLAYKSHYSKLRHGDRAWFDFDSTTGDLIAHRVMHNHAGPVDKDVCESISALADIARNYGLKRQAKHQSTKHHGTSISTSL